MLLLGDELKIACGGLYLLLYARSVLLEPERHLLKRVKEQVVSVSHVEIHQLFVDGTVTGNLVHNRFIIVVELL